MSDSSIIVANERQKLLSTVASNFGTGLFAAGVVKVYADKAVAIESVVWIVIGISLIWGSWKALGLDAET